MPAKFTVIVPTHNRRDMLLLALESIRLQTRPPEQVIVVADGCTDGSVEAVRALGDDRIEVLDLPKAPGHGWENRNEALRRATGDAIAYLADDDMWMPDHLERVAPWFDTGEADLVQTNVCVVTPDGGLQLWSLDWRVPAYRVRFVEGTEHRTPMSAVSHRRGLAEEVGGWRTVEIDHETNTYGDADLWRRMLRSGPRLAALAEPTVLFFQAWRDADTDRGAQAAGYAARLRDPVQLARLRGEMSRTVSESEAGYRGEIARLEAELEALRSAHAAATAVADESAGLTAQLEGLRREEQRLRERETTLKRIEAGGWWRLRGRLLPVLRLAQALRLSPASRRGRRG